MKHKFNYLCLLAAPALIALLYFPTGETSFLGFLGFLVFVRYQWVNPDELFLLTLRRAATAAFLLEGLLLPLTMTWFYFSQPGANPMPGALGASYGASLFFFCIYHAWLEHRELEC